MLEPHVVWDKFENRIHRGPMTKDEAEGWMAKAREAFADMPRPEGVDEIWEVRPA